MHHNAKLSCAGIHVTVIARDYQPHCQSEAFLPNSLSTASDMTTNNSVDGVPPAKKFRVACRRCRIKRVKVSIKMRVLMASRLTFEGVRVMGDFQPVETVHERNSHALMWTLAIMTYQFHASELAQH